ncbi:3'-5' exonuclease [uncultured Muribaculum sp.]|uniref:3'-5' exonuclease n=1 Tax=uncultured Muribaculum sp. TaxID=1918613 RepID=UPI002597181B|nr:3'-5' exonuclease [uncultured Muribaculum sp.]
MDLKMVALSISKEELSELPTVVYPGEIIVINTAEEAKAALEVISGYSVIGFDTETKPSFKKGYTNKVALIQIATDDACYLFRINKFGLIDEIIDLFQNTNVLKVGLSLRDDYMVMHKSREFGHENFIDLQNFVRSYGISDSSLQKIYGIVFNGRISKGQRLSNWEAETLSPSQQMYAAIDAWACLKIYQSLVSEEFDMEKSPYLKEVPSQE